jgi:2-methylfumaryl-CoA isomerase
MYNILSNMRVIEAASFVAAPSAGLYLSQMGADFNRWPKAANGSSLYWEGLNKGKRSLALNLSKKEGRELLQELVTAPGDGGGLFLTNFPASGFLSHDSLAAKRPDLITARVMGQADGGPALDYTVNCALGIPNVTGPASLGDEPVNHVLPAWDLLTGSYAAFALLAAERHRRDTGQGQELRIPLSDVGISAVANLGMLAEALTHGNRPRYGNDLYGAFGRDYVTKDGQRIMLVAITGKQWKGLVEVLGIGDEIAAVEKQRGVTFGADEGARFEHLDALVPLFRAAMAKRTLAELQPAFDRDGVCWGPYKTMKEAATDKVLVQNNPIFSVIEQTSKLTYPVPGAAATLPQQERQPPRRAPRLGEHSEAVLADVLRLPQGAIGKLFDDGIVA